MDVTHTPQADRFNQGKPQWSLVDFDSFIPMVRVLEYGCKKYSRDNWKKGLPANEIIESMLRHVYAMLKGELTDPESGQPHIGHIQCNAMFLAYMLENKPQFNNLIKQPEFKLIDDENQDTDLHKGTPGGCSTAILRGTETCGNVECEVSPTCVQGGVSLPSGVCC